MINPALLARLRLGDSLVYLSRPEKGWRLYGITPSGWTVTAEVDARTVDELKAGGMIVPGVYCGWMLSPAAKFKPLRPQ
ncbi:hypothetical protein [Fimbriiglobus ruber]|uniref:Uncharacterized protein n=1 Tax=Fimbriiglobus ruber TaxID=1908690 RepID=A0A225D029_9BACT|nr:hypothetical protein [Fimbriiglobus ruber]OWK34941.1 hypothetical protein FRUB_09783 [Fimbriiglobus ruber]